MKVFRILKHDISFSENSKKSRLHTDNMNYKRARNRLQALIKNKKQQYIRENIEKPKELWKTLSQLGLPSKHKST